jgi:hypothetical protein
MVFRLGLGVALLLMVMGAGTAAALPQMKDTGDVIEVTLLLDAQARASADPSATVVRTIAAGSQVYLLETARDSSLAVWYHVAMADGSDLGWILQRTGQITSISMGTDSGMFNGVMDTPAVMPVAP